MLKVFTADAAARPAQELPVLESCLLGEFAHRIANDMTCASAAVRLARRASGEAQHAALDRLAAQLDALGAIQRLMQAPPPGRQVDLGDQLSALCRAMVVARFADRNVELRLSVEALPVDAACGWRMLMIVAELLVNAARHAFDEAGGVVLVEAFGRGDQIVCAIHDDGRGWAGGRRRRTGYGSAVVRMLVGQIGGRLKASSSGRGTSIELAVPRAANDLSWTESVGGARAAART